ncbi:hypothetical protein HPB51_025036 [Rhipicephalus microplus]|uniref:HTH psq-type domain-containing protein n=1 Tax=Rhipicephalus microplus TaxID=6941 RepID=A0A9J6DDT4_RHIMP|nr:hypothetical protein HPB51_025036 [Rhipicephalus microplus]
MAPTPPVAAPSGVKKRGQRGSYKTLTMAKKAEIIRQVEGGRPQSEVAREFSISKQTVSDYLKQKSRRLRSWRQLRKRLRVRRKISGMAATRSLEKR